MVKDTYVRMRRVGFVDSFDPSKSVQAIHIYIYAQPNRLVGWAVRLHVGTGSHW